MKLARLMTLGFLLLTVSTARAAQLPELERIEGGTLVFKGQTPVVTQLKEIKYLGLLASTEGAPFLILTGRNCIDCLEDRAVFLVRQDGSRTFQFVQPGKILDPKSKAILFDSRAFFGRCLPGGAAESYVVFQKELVEKKRHGRRYKSIEPSVFVAEPNPQGLQEKLSELRSPGSLESRQRHTLAQVKRKQCFEIETRARPMLAKPLDLKARRDGDDADDEDETPPAAGSPGETDSPRLD